MNTLSYLRTEIDWAHELLAMTMIDVTPEMAQVIPSGVANPLGAIYAHAILAEDGIINGLLKQSTPLFASSWVGKTGVAARNAARPGMGTVAEARSSAARRVRTGGF